jgi:hypothetical protein
MLFDLRGRGRRRTVQGIYLTLAILMGGGLVLFGVGSGNGIGGLFDAFKSNGGSAKSVVSSQEKAAERTVRLHPNDAAAWANLAEIRFTTAKQNYDPNAGQFTTAGLKELRAAATAWNRYLALNPKRPDPNVARVMVQAYLPGGLNDLVQAASAQEIVAGADPKIAANWEQLAVIAGAAGQPRKSALAAQKAQLLLPGSQWTTVKQQIEQEKKALAQQLAQAQAQGG